MSDPPTTPPPFGEDPQPGGPPQGPPPAPPGQFDAPPPAPPGQWGAQPPAPPGQFGAPPSAPPGQFGAPPPAAPGQYGWGQPSAYQQPAQAYQYGSGVASSVELAQPGTRIGARIIDWLIMAAVLIPMYLLLVGGASVGADSAVGGGLVFGGFLLFVVAATVGQVLYEVAFVAIKGQTPGKMLLKVKVVREVDGQIPGWGPAFLRWIPNLVSLVPCAGSFLSIGLIIWALVNLFSNPKRQTPFDLLAKTLVVTKR